MELFIGLHRFPELFAMDFLQGDPLLTEFSEENS